MGTYEDAYGQRTRESSNSFASGANQNCGNHLTNVLTTRVLKPPGGGSSLSLSWDTGPAQQLVPGIGSGGIGRSGYAPPDASITSQPSEDRSTGPKFGRRQIAPPGGRSSMDLSWAGANGNDSHQGRVRPNGEACQREVSKQDRGQEERFPASPPPRLELNDIPSSWGSRAARGPPHAVPDFRLPERRMDAPVVRREPDEIANSSDSRASRGPMHAAPDLFASESREEADARVNYQRHCGVGTAPEPTAAGVAVSYTDDSKFRPGRAMRDAQLQENSCVKKTLEADAHNLVRNSFDKCEIEGSRPRAYKPSIRLKAPPGGDTAFKCDWTGGHMAGPKGGRQHFPDGDSAGANRDTHNLEALRYYADSDDRMGKQKGPETKAWAERSALDSQRYHLAAEAHTNRGQRMSSRGEPRGGSPATIDPFNERRRAQPGSMEPDLLPTDCGQW